MLALLAATKKSTQARNLGWITFERGFSASTGSEEALIYCDRHLGRRNTVGHHFERTSASFRRQRNIEVCVHYRLAGRHTHCAVIMGPGIEDVPRGFVRDPHQWIVGCSLEFVTKGSRLRQPIELLA